MIDLDKIEQQCKNAMQNGYGHLPVIECGNAVKVMELITRIRQAEKDAARYRWLRDLPGDSAHEEIGNYPGDMWDDAIDEAMQCSK